MNQGIMFWNWLKSNARTLFAGITVGAANIIPGVSGGTIAYIFGVYHQLMDALGNVATEKKDRAKRIQFLVLYFLGGIVSVLFFARLIDWSFETFPKPTIYFFAGLIIGSFPMIVRSQKDMTIRTDRAVGFLVGLLLVVILAAVQQNPSQTTRLPSVIAQNDFETIVLAERMDPTAKDQLLAFYVLDSLSKEYILHGEPSKDEETTLSKWVDRLWYKDVEWYHYLYYILCGAIAASATVIPGISGPFVLLILGVYWLFLSSLSGMTTIFLEQGFSLEMMVRLGVLAAITLGSILGMIFISKWVNWCLKHAPSIATFTMLGLVVGSIYPLITIGEQLQPGFHWNLDLGLMILMFVLGLFLSYFLSGTSLKKSFQE